MGMGFAVRADGRDMHQRLDPGLGRGFGDIAGAVGMDASKLSPR